MNESQPSEPSLFLKRSRRVQKRRRVVSQFSLPDTKDSSAANNKLVASFSSSTPLRSAATADDSPPPQHEPSRARPYSVRIKPRVQTKLKQAPLIPGYEPESDPTHEKQASYTEEQLKQLKQKLRIAPHSRPPSLPNSSNEPSPRVSKEPSKQKQDIEDKDDITPSKRNKLEQRTRSSEKQLFSSSQSPRAEIVPKIPGTAAAAPFSAEWNARIFDDDDIEVEPVSNFSRTEDHGSDNEGADVEWEAQLMRRAAQKTCEQDQYMLRREMNIIRDAETEGMQTGAFKRLKADIAKRVEELAEQQAYVEQKIQRLEQVVKQDLSLKGNARTSVDKLRRKVELYENLVQKVSTASRDVAASDAIFERWESFVDSEMEERIRKVTVRLKGGVDNFGRERKAQILDVEELRDEFREWGGRLVEKEQKEVTELRGQLGFSDIMRLVKEWCERFPEEYNSAFIDAGLGKLLGKLGLLENDIRFIHKLELKEGTIQMGILAFGVERFATWIRARWEPREPESCEFVGELMRAVNAAQDDTKEVIRRSLQDRLALEIEALEAFGNEGIIEVVRGLTTIAKKARFDPGFDKALQTCENVCELKGLDEELEWLGQCSFMCGEIGTIRRWRDRKVGLEHHDIKM
eukprot:TRINITY_DN307_c0_g1_i1.p2 TRINITY_DN307_c0_g1~~TRINITY_DN307_c0_g1_i1.p2  ORF type:complete len:632 (-),score=109.68 TRINITY_DN307_c0_g1_i1:1856-3751(-)